MGQATEPEKPENLADQLDEALGALWRSDTAPLEHLLDSSDGAAPHVAKWLSAAANPPIAAEYGPPEIGGYEIVEEIGEGGMGRIYKALQQSTNRLVAVKVMKVNPFASGADRQRFQREVELTARLQHPGIVHVLEAGETDAGLPYYTMDFVSGIPLGDWLTSSQPDVPATLALFRDVCLAVEYAHKLGVIHRDLKPGNVLVDEDDKPHVLDFGLAKAIDSAGAEEKAGDFSLPGQFVGTLRYSSPEQLQGSLEEIDAGADVYALGVMLFEALTGSLPFDCSGSGSDVARRIAKDPPAVPSSRSKRVDGKLDAVVLKALDKDKAYRYESAQALGDDLDRYIRGEPVLHRPDILYRLRKRAAKHPFRVALGALAIVLAIGGSYGGLSWQRHQRTQRAEEILRIQSFLESGRFQVGYHQALSFRTRYLDLPESELLLCHAYFRRGQDEQNKRYIRMGIVRLERELARDQSQWSYSFLLANMKKSLESPEWKRWQGLAEQYFPNTPGAWYLRSFATLDLEEAKRCAREAVTRRPHNSLAWIRLARLCHQTGADDEAVDAAQTLVGLGVDPHSWTAFQGYICLEDGRYEEAFALYERASALAPTMYGYRYRRYRALAHLCMREYDLAVADYTTVLEGCSSGRQYGTSCIEGWEYYYRATPLWILGERERAAQDYEALLAKTNHPYAFARLFLLLREQASCARERNDSARAEDFSRKATKVLVDARQAVAADSWPGPIFACLADDITPRDLVASVKATDRVRACEAYYYAGESCLLRDEKSEARAWFRKCVDTNLPVQPVKYGPVPMSEYHLALWRLDSLSSDAAASPD